MTRISPFLTFNGNCREAMTFYHNCFGGEIQFQTIGDSPLGKKLSSEIQEYILHASISTKHFTMMGTDMIEEQGLMQGNAVSIWVECMSKNELYTYYHKLAEKGEARQPIEQTFSGALLGGLVDKFGKHWLFHWRT
ncbi:glyoxalase [Roseivirga seohaensis]|uniref:Glyoxalase n=1 Tax=Roseivirga seohaensis TaxID=1914963 RepID=A0A150XLN8_9BACT|nr:VOC family protein [Roseivirga seohaensis]KYG79667.1 glyoxalase [Roseivirga seohaensis]